MKNITPERMAYLLNDTTTDCLVWSITKKDATVLRYTNHDRPLTFQGEVYSPDDADAAKAFSHTDSLSVDNSEGIVSTQIMTEDDIKNGIYDNLPIEIYRINWQDPGQGHTHIFTGTTGNISHNVEQAATVELRGLQQKLQQQQGDILQPTCRASVGDAICTVDLAPFTETGTVTAVSDSQGFSTAMGQADSWFKYGKFTWLTGDNAGQENEVREFVNGDFILFDVAANPIQINDTFEVKAGCDRSKETCINKFNNMINFYGEPDKPTVSQLYGQP